MYYNFYGMKRSPFENSIDTDLFYSSPQHEAAWEFLIQGMRLREQYNLVLGEYGLGKSTLAVRLEKKLAEQGRVLYRVVPNPNCSYASILSLVASAYFSEETIAPGNVENVQDLLIKHFQDSKPLKPIYMVFDDFHEADTVSTIPRLFSFSKIMIRNIPVIRWILFAHVDFARVLKAGVLQALDQRIRRRFLLEPFGLEHTKEYIYFRLYRSGAVGVPRFQPDAIQKIHEHSRGIPRMINNICDRSLQLGALSNSMIIDVGIVEKALESVDTYETPNRFPLKPLEGGYGEPAIENAEDLAKTSERSGSLGEEMDRVAQLDLKALGGEFERNEDREASAEAEVTRKSSGLNISAYFFAAILVVLIIIALRLYHVF